MSTEIFNDKASMTSVEIVELVSSQHSDVKCSIDHRTHFVDAGYAKECAQEGMARTQVIWLKEEVIKVWILTTSHYPGRRSIIATIA